MAGAGGATRGQGFYDARGRYVTVSRIRYIGSKTFYIKKGELVDAELGKDPKFVKIVRFSDEYFKLVRENADFRNAQAVGANLSINVGNERIEVEK